MKKRYGIVALLFLAAAALAVVLYFLSLGRFHNGTANANFNQVKPVRAVRVDYINVDQSRKLLPALENNLRAAGVNWVAVGAGRTDWTYFAWRGHPGQWSSDVKTLSSDFLADESIRFGKWAHVTAVVDALSPLYIQAHPESAAISWTGQVSKNLVGPLEMVDGQPGENLLSMIEDIAANYPVNSVMISEMVYYVDGFSEKDRAAYLAASGRSDWPRTPEGKINIDDPSIGSWRANALNSFYARAVKILHPYNKELLVEINATVDSDGKVTIKNGTDPQLMLTTVDRLVVRVNGLEGRPTPQALGAAAKFAAGLPTDRIILMVGLWNNSSDDGIPKEQMAAIPASELKTGLQAALQGGAENLLITPSFLFSDSHWQALKEGWTQPTP